MTTRTTLDARHISDILIWVLETYGHWSPTGAQAARAAHLQPQDFPETDVSVESTAIASLAEQLRIISSIDASQDPSAFTHLLAQIALIANAAGPDVGGLPTDAKAMVPLARRVCTDFAIACAVVFAGSRGYFIDYSAIPREETSFALVMNDDQALVRIFTEALNLPLIARNKGRHAARYSKRRPGNSSRSSNREPSLSARMYTEIRRMAQVEGFTLAQLFQAIEDQLSSPRGRHARNADLGHADDADPDVFIRRLERDFAAMSPMPELVSAERRLTATSYWNLRSVAETEEWSSVEVLALVDEHLIPTLNPEFVHHYNSVTGSDWKRLYAWKFEAG